MKPKLKMLVIKRSEWLRGKTPSYLRNYKGEMCCLGFACMQLLHLPVYAILARHTPSELLLRLNETLGAKLMELGLVEAGGNTAICGRLMTINDDQKLTDRQREAALKKLFLTIGIRCKFVP